VNQSERVAPVAAKWDAAQLAVFVIARSQRIRPEVAGPMTGSATKQSSIDVA
jgi:hypothetical protein